MKKKLKKMFKYFNSVGIDIVRFVFALRGIPGFIQDYLYLKKEVDKSIFPIKIYPILDDKYREGG